MTESTNSVVRNAMSAQEVKKLAALLKARPWDDPKYKARVKDELNRDARRILGDAQTKEIERALMAHGLWKG